MTDKHNVQSLEREFLELLCTYPSPHNGQPMVLDRESEGTYTVLFQTDRGLTATEISYLFSFVTIGVFFEYAQACAAALGHEITIEHTLPTVDQMGHSSSELVCGTITVVWNERAPDEILKKALQFRQTSRKIYTAGLSETEKAKLHGLTTSGQELRFVEQSVAHQVIWLNQRAVFDDMFDPPVRKELSKWLRTSRREKLQHKDGLSYDCMELNGTALRFILRHYQVLHWPIISTMLKQYYLRTMSDSSTVGYMITPFAREQDAYDIGQTIIRIWLTLSQQGSYLHPFGTIVSNDQAHKDFTRLAGLSAEDRKSHYVTFIFRAGYSETPARSERLGLGHLVRGVSW